MFSCSGRTCGGGPCKVLLLCLNRCKWLCVDSVQKTAGRFFLFFFSRVPRQHERLSSVAVRHLVEFFVFKMRCLPGGACHIKCSIMRNCCSRAIWSSVYFIRNVVRFDSQYAPEVKRDLRFSRLTNLPWNHRLGICALFRTAVLNLGSIEP